MDDFSFKKGHTYGVLICDALTNRPIEMLPNREEATVSEWLGHHQEITQISRDRYAPFREAIESTAPAVIHVLDRFHLIQNLWTMHESVIHSLLPNQISLQEEDKDSIPAPPPATKLQRTQQENQEKKWQRALRIQSMFASGQSISAIARELSLNWRTVQKDLSRKEPMDTTSKRELHAVFHWKETIERFEAQHQTTKEIYKRVCEHGYGGSYSGVRQVVETIRRRRKHGMISRPPMLSRKRACALLWKWKMDGTLEERRFVDRLLQRFPLLKPSFVFVHSFRDAMRNKDGGALISLLTWEFSRKESKIAPFVRRLLHEKEHVMQACINETSNGFVEGHINRLKVIKRVMYGRASFVLLKKKVLYDPHYIISTY